MSVFRSRFFWKIYATFALLFLSNTLIVSWIVFYKVKATIQTNLMNNLKAKAEFLLPHGKEMFLGRALISPTLFHALGDITDTRITFIRKDGEVLIDSDSPTNVMDNHWQRPEVQAALVQPYGIAERFSDTTQKAMIYLAKAIHDEQGTVLGVVRVSLSTDKIKDELSSLQITMGLIALLGIILALAIGWALAKRVAVPIRDMVAVAEAMRSGRYEAKVKNTSGDELGRLGDTLNSLGSELVNKISDLQRLETVRRDFVANVSHEIKTPLTSIKGYVETLLAGAINEPDIRIRFLEKIERNAERLASLVQDILSLAKIEAGEDRYQPTPVEWRSLVQTVISRYEDSFFQKNLSCKVHLPPTPVIVMGDKEAIIQVLDNLFTNAIKYTPEGGRITVTLKEQTGWARLDVQDTGIGIAAEHLPRIFERFYRVDKARSRELGGTGLGLSIVKHLIAAMQGEVGVESEIGVGSKFSVRLRT